MFNPISTYRLQFHREFNFSDFEKTLDYLKKLGVKTIYASPIFESVPGSVHGYDSVDPLQINPEIGSLEQLKSIKGALNNDGIGWLQDIVPNHMAFHPNNAWLMDVLEKGTMSPYKSFFDLVDNDDLFHGQLMVPFLGDDLETVIKNNELSVQYDGKRFVLNYFDTNYPLSLRSYTKILQASPDEPSQSVSQLVDRIKQLQEIQEKQMFSLAFDEFLLQLSSLQRQDDVQHLIIKSLAIINEDKGRLTDIANQQEYRLCSWKETDSRINYRRFFTVNGLICLNIQDADIFEKFHQFIADLVKLGIFNGLRVDHIDGLYDPAEYLERLRALAGDEVYLTVEKILELGEELPSWPIEGNTGYDFLAMTNNVLSYPGSVHKFNRFYESFNGKQAPIHDQVLEKKRNILYNHMGGELQNLCNLLLRSNLVEKDVLENIDQDDLKSTIGEFLVQLPWYRFYGNAMPLVKEEGITVNEIFQTMRKDNSVSKTGIDLLDKILLQKPLKENAEYNASALHFYQRCMQFSGPLMAKGVEDTLMYTHSRFIAHNEVGDSPESFGISTEIFHNQMKDRQQKWPLSINATATHDTKRGEDVRARLNVLTAIGDEWINTVKDWQKLSKDLKIDGLPNANDEYFIYQTVLGAYPMPGTDDADFEIRMHEYIEKALREGKENSDWAEPNENYERAVKQFISALLNPEGDFLPKFKQFHQRIADFGIVNSLAQVLLKFTCPGIPDVYQGCELWDLSLVDPDNRRPVNYERNAEWLNEILSGTSDYEKLVSKLWDDRYSGKIKLWLVNKLMQERKNNEQLFAKGEYVPLSVKGHYRHHILAFARRHKQAWNITIVPLHLPLEGNNSKMDWKDTRVVLPPEIPSSWENILLNTTGETKGVLFISDLFKDLPIALLKLERSKNPRGAGILLPVASLPSRFGIGDMGAGAYEFASFLGRSCQKYWQVLPLGPIESVNGNSPYSSCSSMAGNTLLISPEILADDKLIDLGDVKKYQLPNKSTADYVGAEKNKGLIFDLAWKNFNNDPMFSHADFDEFCIEEASWLKDFALYSAIKIQNENKPWYEWPQEFKLRNASALDNFSAQNANLLQKQKWLQYIFFKQWKKLKTFCNNLDIKILGDLPFYVNYDSVDVWANPSIFSLDDEGNLTGVAGVPPDYFNSDGQLWGMPVFKWDVLKSQNYDWWIQRIAKNMQLYDLLRLDHFRAFSNYWQVPAGESTAINGKWYSGPGADFFHAVERSLGKLNFVAEDLGDVDDAVYELRDEFNLPGMKVLQFAFGDGLAESKFIPHNYSPNFFVYTGTHDNNTTVGWHKQEAVYAKEMLKKYTGLKVSKKNIHHVLTLLAYASVAETAIIPVQDLLGLDESARINIPSSASGNWAWRLAPKKLKAKHEKLLREWADIYNRC